MHADLLILALAVVFAAVYRVLFRELPRERWQFVASLPLAKNGDGSWRGLNLTFYGLFTGLAGGLGVATFIVLTGASRVPLTIALGLTAGVLAICLPAAKIIAGVVEKNRHGFTVGGASFIGILLAPLLLWGADAIALAYWQTALPIMPLLAAMAIAYVLGEGVGRLACISFGCCYGKPVHLAPHWAKRCFGRLHHVFLGKTKKIAFAGDMEAVRVVPIQALTCVLHTALALFCASLFFHGLFAAAFALALVGSQLWRVYSEFLRADYRGGSRRFSVYQSMALLAAGYGVLISLLLPAMPAATPFPGSRPGGPVAPGRDSQPAADHPGYVLLLRHQHHHHRRTALRPGPRLARPGRPPPRTRQRPHPRHPSRAFKRHPCWLLQRGRGSVFRPSGNAVNTSL